jgi:hypothetical protein
MMRSQNSDDRPRRKSYDDNAKPSENATPAVEATAPVKAEPPAEGAKA